MSKEMKLECLKLAVSRTSSPLEAVAAAKAYYKFCTEDEKPQAETKAESVPQKEVKVKDR